MNTKIKKKKLKTRVTVILMDGWDGPEILYAKEFSYRKNAEKYANSINSKNTLDHVPSEYTIARID
jgi:hypothetical protein